MIQKLNKIAEDSIYKAPEIIDDSWSMLGYNLYEILGDVKEDSPEWIKRISMIIRGKLENEVN